MNTSNKTLLQILTEELPKNGGWPEGVEAMAQDADGAVQNYSDTRDIRINDEFAHGSSRIACSYSIESGECEVSTDRLTAIITREQYEAALAAKNEGWIEWGGGKCPLHHGAIVDVKLRNGRTEYAQEALCIKGYASYAFWRKDNTSDDIIAYRLHQPQQADWLPWDECDGSANSRANDDRLAGDLVSAGLVEKPIDDACRVEADLNECFGQPQSNDQARDEILYELANFAASTRTSLDIGAATKIAIWLSDKGYRKH